MPRQATPRRTTKTNTKTPTLQVPQSPDEPQTNHAEHMGRHKRFCAYTRQETTPVYIVRSGNAAPLPDVHKGTVNLTDNPLVLSISLIVQDKTRTRKHESVTSPRKKNKNVPNDEAGPPTFVLFVPPDPIPGLKRTPIELPGASSLSLRSWLREQALIPTPLPSSSAALGGSS